MKTFGTKPALVLALMLGGCATTLGVQRETGPSQYSEGVVQVLPFTQYEVTATWRLVSCDVQSQTHNVVDNVNLKVTAVASAQDDPEQRYLIDATSLQGPLTRSQFSVAYHDDSNTLKSVNAEVEDRTAAFVTNVVGTVATLARTFTGVPPIAGLSRDASGNKSGGRAGGTVRTPPPSFCTEAAVAALQRVEALEAELAGANRDVDGASDEVARLGAIVARVGDGVDPATAARFAAAIEHLEEVTASQARIAGLLNNALAAVTVSEVARWPQNGRQFDRTDAFTIPQRALREWFGPRGDGVAWPQSYLAIRASNGATQDGGSGPPPGRVTGIPYRVNVRGRLISCPQICGSTLGRTIAQGTVAQLGGVAVLPVRNPPLGSSTFAAVFNRDGTLVSSGFEQRRAPLEEASAIANSATTGLAPLFDRTQRLERETAYLEALQERRAAADALNPAEPSAAVQEATTLKAENTLLDAQIANLEARIRLRDLQARVGSQ